MSLHLFFKPYIRLDLLIIQLVGFIGLLPVSSFVMRLYANKADSLFCIIQLCVSHCMNFSGTALGLRSPAMSISWAIAA